MTRFCAVDVGISTTDAVAEWTAASVSLRTAEPVATARAALSQLLSVAPPPAGGDVVVAATGTGAHRLADELLGLPVRKVPEITAMARGGMGVTGRSEGLVVSLGSGTALISVRGDDVRHIVPGCVLGGGSLLGLSRLLLGTDDLAAVARLAREGDHAVVDMTIGEAVGGSLGALPADVIAASFVKASAGSRASDVAAALATTIAEVSLAFAMLGLQASGHTSAILIGKLLLFEPIARHVEEVVRRFGGTFVVAPHADIATALGALWSVGGDRLRFRSEAK